VIVILIVNVIEFKLYTAQYLVVLLTLSLILIVRRCLNYLASLVSRSSASVLFQC